jgi:surface antigen
VVDLSDQILMAHADGELEPAERARVDSILARDPATRARWEMFEATGKTLAERFRMDEPVPQRLVDLILGKRGAWVRFSDNINARGLRTVLNHFVSGYTPAWRSVLAYSAVLVVGACGGWLLHGDTGAPKVSPTFVVHTDGRILAQGVLQRALETAPSGVRIESIQSLERAAAVQVRLSFKSREHAFCRQYEVTLADGPRPFTGIGCRGNDGHWQVQVNTLDEAGQPARGKVVPAGADGPLAAYIGRMIEGDALDSTQESAAISKKWRAALPPS